MIKNDMIYKKNFEMDDGPAISDEDFRACYRA